MTYSCSRFCSSQRMNAIINTVLFFTLRCTIGLILCLVVLLTLQIIRISKAPSHIPWVGLRNRRILPKLRACLSELTAGQSMINEGYEKVSRRPFKYIHTVLTHDSRASMASMASPSSSPAYSGTPSFSHPPTLPGSLNNPTRSSAAPRPSTSSWASIILPTGPAQSLVETSL